jgi:FAD/FMN-containing dehydrogenase
VTAPLAQLERAIDGDVIGADSPAFARLRQPFNARFDDVIPQAVVRCSSAEDVAATVAFVRRHGLPTAIRSGGHDFAGRSTTTGIVIDVSTMRSVRVEDGLLRVEAGAVLGEVYREALRHGLTIPGGSCPSVGVAGLTLGGGLGIQGRTYGVTSDRLAAARIVLADGRTLECDVRHHDDLFWALRGGGTGHFGVVTDFVFEPIPAHRATSFLLTWSFDDAPAVADAWMRWSPDGPDALAASMVLAASADTDEPPRVEVFGTMLGSRTDAVEQLENLAAMVRPDPASSNVEERSYEDTMRYWADRAGERLEEPRAAPAGRAIYLIRSEFFARSLPADAIASLLEGFVADRVGGQSRELDFSPWGGAYVRVPSDATAFVHRDARFWIKHAVALPADADAAAVESGRRWVTGSWNSVHALGTGGVFPNFADPDMVDWGRAYHGTNLERLIEVKTRYDPENVFRSRQSLPVR